MKRHRGSLLQKSPIVRTDPLNVIPAKAGIQSFQRIMDPRLRGGDSSLEFCKRLGGHKFIDMSRTTDYGWEYQSCNKPEEQVIPPKDENEWLEERAGQRGVNCSAYR